ncbi:MAG: MFS transporter [Gemmatimonadetes bacterium]|nr:MFS transporter [Gemmatimonadota bacterium]
MRGYRRLQEYGLTAGTLGSTAGQTVMVAVLPVLLARYAPSAVWIGFAIGGEGIIALVVPYWIGYLSDHLPHRLARRFGRRTFFLLACAPLMALSVAVAPFLRGYWPLAAAGLVYFAALHGYLAPLWALMVDAVPDERRGRVHGVRGALHAAGLGYGLVAGGLLYAIWPPLPFLVAALLIAATTALTVAAAPPSSRNRELHEEPGPGEAIRIWHDLRNRPAIRWFLIANALWTGAVDGIRPYVFLFAVAVLGITVAEASLVLTLLVAGLGLGAVILGHLGDRHGRDRLLVAGAVVTGVAMMFGLVVRTVPAAVALLLGSGLGAAALIALPYPLFARLVGSRAVGRYTGLYILTVGLGRIVAPVLVGAAIDLGSPLFPETKGYPLMWPVAGALALTGAAALVRAIRAPAPSC